MIEPTNKSIDLSALRIDREQPKDRGRWIFPLVATVIVLAVAFLLVKGRSSGALALRPAEVATTRVSLVTPVQASTVLTASGYIVARAKAEISPKSVGRIAWMNLEEGQKVRKGELVARLESQELVAQKQQALATKKQYEAQLENARLEVGRAQSMWKQQVGTREQLDTWTSNVKSLEAQVATADSQIRYFDELIKNAEIYAPIDGVVTVKKAFVGETVAPQGFGGAGSAGATFAVIVDLASLEMEADINEQNLGKLSLGQPAEVNLDAYPDKPYKARLRQIVPTADRQKGSVKVKVELLDKDAKVLPEMSARVVFINPQAKMDQEEPSKVMVPTSSVVEIGDERGVLLVSEEKAVFKPLQLGAAVGAQQQVLSGVQGGEEIVADAAAAGHPWKREQKIRIKKE
jgi:RND family efflux transporter MFP subunit